MVIGMPAIVISASVATNRHPHHEDAGDQQPPPVVEPVLARRVLGEELGARDGIAALLQRHADGIDDALHVARVPERAAHPQHPLAVGAGQHELRQRVRRVDAVGLGDQRTLHPVDRGADEPAREAAFDDLARTDPDEGRRVSDPHRAGNGHHDRQQRDDGDEIVVGSEQQQRTEQRHDGRDERPEPRSEQRSLRGDPDDPFVAVAGACHRRPPSTDALRAPADPRPRRRGSRWRRMGDSNPRGLSPNTLSKRAP